MDRRPRSKDDATLLDGSPRTTQEPRGQQRPVRRGRRPDDRTPRDKAEDQVTARLLQAFDPHHRRAVTWRPCSGAWAGAATTKASTLAISAAEAAPGDWCDATQQRRPEHIISQRCAHEAQTSPPIQRFGDGLCEMPLLVLARACPPKQRLIPPMTHGPLAHRAHLQHAPAFPFARHHTR